MTPRTWKCQGCKTVWPRTKQKCTCGRYRPAVRRPKHRAVLDRPYEWWVEQFGDRCGICGATQKPGGPRLHRDHEHVGPNAGMARGILCFRCNSALPSRVTAEWMEAALAYLHNAEPRRA